METAVAFDYRLVGKGSSEARFAVGSQWIGLTASYLDDALGDLLLAARLLVEGSGAARASWAEEPGEFRWLLDRTGDEVRVRILAFPELWSDAPDDDGDALLDVTCDLRAFTSALALGARQVLNTHGEQGYREEWVDHPFPTEHLAVSGRSFLPPRPSTLGGGVGSGECHFGEP